MKRVYEFKEGSKEQIALLGGKGGNLAEMTKIGLSIPNGIIVTTDACREFFKQGSQISRELRTEILERLKSLKKNPLLVSVRSGAPISMPGMMDTILNVGFNDEVAKQLLESIQDENFVYTSYARFISMFSEIVKEIEKKEFEILAEQIPNPKDRIAAFKKLYQEKTGEAFPENVEEQILMAVHAIFHSWNNERAILYRKLNHIDDEMGTAVVIQEMVFGNFNQKSGTGVVFSRNPSTGEKKIFGEYLICAQGEDIVAGLRTPEAIATLEKEMPEVYAELVKNIDILEKHNKDMQDIEFTIEDGKLYLLQTRNGKRAPKAAVKIAIDLEAEGILTKEEALMKIDPSLVNQLLTGNFEEEALKKAIFLGKGLAASSGVAVGRVMFDSKRVKIREKTILVREETSPEDLKGMALAQGILTVKGGATSHGAVVARGMGKCCITGCGELKINELDREMYIGGRTIKEGEFISISGYTGEIFLGKIAMKEASYDDDLKTILSWAKEIKRLQVRMNADTPEDVKMGKSFGAEGIGLCRTEHMFFKKDKIWTIREVILGEEGEEKNKAIEKLFHLQKEDFKGIFQNLNGDVANIRLLDPPVHEFLPKERADKIIMAKNLGIHLDDLDLRIRKLKDENPMLGYRGCRLGIAYPRLYRIQGRAILEAALECKQEGHPVHPEIMIPFVMEAKELAYVKAQIQEEIEALFLEKGERIPYKLGTMIEIPRACLLADDIAKEADFFSFGTNDLTQMSMGLSRDDSVKFLDQYREKGIWEGEPFYSIDQKAVGKLVEMGVQLGRAGNQNLTIGICGEHGGDPKSIEFFEKNGFDYISCSPFRVPAALLAAAQSYIKFRK